MSVFDQSTKVGRRVADPGTDKTLPPSGALSWGGITGASGVAGTVGVDAKLVHGDRWQQITGNQTENITSDLKTTVTGDQTHTIVGNQTITVSQNHQETIIGNCLQTIIGPQITTNMDVRNETRAVTHAHTHGDHFFVYGPDNLFHYCETNMGAWIFMFEAEVQHTEIGLQHLEFKPVMHNYFAGIDTSVCAIRGQNQALNEEVSISWGTIRLLQGHISALNTKAGVLEAKLEAMEANASVHRVIGAAP
jgi:Gp5-like OB domain-containing protein